MSNKKTVDFNQIQSDGQRFNQIQSDLQQIYNHLLDYKKTNLLSDFMVENYYYFNTTLDHLEKSIRYLIICKNKSSD